MKITTADDRENSVADKTTGRISTSCNERVCAHRIILLLRNDFITYRYNYI
jgi:hypothetical protein